MQFNSIGASNAGNYARAGKAVADSAANVFKVQRETGPDYAEISKTAMVTQAEENITALKAAEKVTNAGVNAFSKVKQISNNEKAKRKIYEIGREHKDKMRKAGAIAGLGKVAAAGYLAASDPTKGREYPTADFKSFFDQWKAQRDGTQARQDAERNALGDFKSDPVKFDPLTVGGDSGKVTTGGGSNTTNTASQTGTLATGTTLTGNAKTIADAVAKYESGDWGYEAFNQGGRAGGTRVVGKSGSHKDTFGRSLTDMTLGEIFHRQNTKQRGLSFQQHLDQGGLHAVGRYQFIGSTLQDEVRRMGLDHNTKFTPEVQDQIFLSHVKRVGSISPWVGPMQHYSASQRAQFNSMIQGL